ncbi:TPA: bacteriophage antitermination protein Q [Kluyvera cryocrescens]
MNTQYLEYVRQQLIVATADFSGATKGQLMAWLENAQFDTGTFKRKKPRVWDEENEKWETLDNSPISGKQSHAKGSHIPLVQPVEFATASWRRALLSLEEHQKAWLLWSYSENTDWDHQVAITQWAWAELSQQLEGKRIAKKTIDRLRQLIWLAAQDTREGLVGRYTYQYADLAAMVGITPKNWSETFTDRWIDMKRIFLHLDNEALTCVMKARSQQKSTNLDESLVKLD